MRTTKLVWVLATAIAVLLGAGMLQYARLGSTTPAGLPTTHLQPATNIPTTAPPATVPSGPALPSAPEPSAAVGPTGPTSAIPATPMPAPATAPASSAAGAGAAPATLTYVVQPGDTLWGLAAAHLGSPLRWYELYNLNEDRAEPGGGALVNPNLIYPGWTLEFPAGATGLPDTSAAGAPSSSGGVAP
jgi:nucleoid-associated protein YgaU